MTHVSMNIKVPAHVAFIDIAAALELVGAFVVERKPKAAKEERVFEQPLFAVKRDADGEVTSEREIDAIEVEKTIRKMTNARAAFHRADGRAAAQFPNQWQAASMSTAEYVQAMESKWHHVPASYSTHSPFTPARSF